MKASPSLFSCNRVKTQASGHEAGGACWPAGVEKLPWKLWEVEAESCDRLSHMPPLGLPGPWVYLFSGYPGRYF